mgnify:CR=1
MKWTVKLNGNIVFQSESLHECTNHVNKNIKRVNQHQKVSISRLAHEQGDE